MGHFDAPSSCIKFKGSICIDAHICSDDGIPGAVALPVEEELDVMPAYLALMEAVLYPMDLLRLVCLAFSSLEMTPGAERLPMAVSYLVFPILIMPMMWHLKWRLWMNRRSSAQGNQLSTSR